MIKIKECKNCGNYFVREEESDKNSMVCDDCLLTVAWKEFAQTISNWLVRLVRRKIK